MILRLLIPAILATTGTAHAETLTFPGNDSGPGKGKHIVLIAGDEEYRSEESCPMLAKILSKRLGFDTTVLFSVNPAGGFVDPNFQKNIPGMEAIGSADLVIIGTRFRDLPDSQLRHLLAYLDAGKPIFGFRTATHAFRTSNKLGDVNWSNFGPDILGEGWAGHYGKHKVQGARGAANSAHADHPILRGVTDVFAESDVYGVKRVTDDNATILMHGVVTDTLSSDSKDTPGKDPQPAVWLRKYKTPNGAAEGTALCSTMGASSDLDNEGLRRLFINAAMVLSGVDPTGKEDISYVDPFTPSIYSFQKDSDIYKKLNYKPADYGYGKSPQSGPKLETLLK